MFYRTQNNVPDVYINGSRDFQLLGRLLDSVVNDTKFYINQIPYINSVKMCPTNLLPLLATKLGFYSKYSFTEEELRAILHVFPWLLRYKGSKRAIYQSIFVFFRIVGINPNFTVEIKNKEDAQPQNHYRIIICFQSKPFETRVLDALFNYVLPPEYAVQYEYVVKITPSPYKEVTAYEYEKVQGIIVGNTTDTQLRGSDFDEDYVGSDIVTNDLLSGVDTALTGYVDGDKINTENISHINIPEEEEQTNE